MKLFNENDTVVYTDAEGRMIDTFVVFNTDPTTGLTHINHLNLKVPSDNLQLHPLTIEKHHLPMSDAFSFELYKKLKDKYTEKQAIERTLKPKPALKKVLAQAS